MSDIPAPIPAASLKEGIAAIAIGGSAGSVEVLGTLLAALRADLPMPVFVVLHVPRGFPSLLPVIFRPRCVLDTVEAQDSEPILPATVYFAPPDYHLLVDSGPRIALSVDEPVHFSRPSIDVLFEAAADLYGPKLLGIILSGASQDGAAGLAAIGRAGGTTIVQQPDSASVAIMPLAALNRSPVDHVLPAAQIAQCLATL
jgi:two-component system chemotaxis response regulator CheB